MRCSIWHPKSRAMNAAGRGCANAADMYKMRSFVGRKTELSQNNPLFILLFTNCFLRIMNSTSSLQCPVCWTVFRDPKVLPTCGHSVCAQCVTRLVGDSTDGRSASCPECRQVSHLPPRSDCFPTNYRLAGTSRRQTRTRGSGPGTASPDPFAQGCSDAYNPLRERPLFRACAMAKISRPGGGGEAFQISRTMRYLKF